MGWGEIAQIKQFFPFPTVFFSLLDCFLTFSSIRNCCLQALSVSRTLKFVVWDSCLQALSVSRTLQVVVWERVNKTVKSTSTVWYKYGNPNLGRSH